MSLVGNYMYDRLGIHGAGSLVAGIATGLSVLPFIAYKYGGTLRAKSKFAKEMAAMQAECSDAEEEEEEEEEEEAA